MSQLKNILLVEDDKDDQFIFKEAIAEVNNSMVSIVSNGVEALNNLENSNYIPDVIFMDINMPLMNGIDCLTELIKNPKTKNIPVIIISTSEEESEVAFNLGAKAFIKKSSDFRTLCTDLKQLLSLGIFKTK